MHPETENSLSQVSLTAKILIAPELRGSVPRIAIRDDQFADYVTPFLIEYSFEKKKIQAFAYRMGDMRANTSAPGGAIEPPVGSIFVSSRLARLSRAVSGDVAHLTPALTWSKTLVAADIDDIPNGIRIHASGLPRGWTMASVGGIAIPFKVVRRSRFDSSAVRIGRHARILTGAKTGDQIQLMQLPRVSLASQIFMHSRVFKARTNFRLLVGQFFSPFAWFARSVNSGVEIFLRAIFRAPEFSLRLSHAYAGDDQDDVVRISPSIFGILGISTGDQVVIRWGRNKSIATALESDSQSTINSPKSGDLGVDNFYVELDETIPQHLVVHLSALTRRDLGCPVDTVVTIRRRLSTLVARHLSLLVLPIMALSISAAALDDKNWWILGSGFVVLSWMSFSSIRLHKVPKGPWP